MNAKETAITIINAQGISFATNVRVMKMFQDALVEEVTVAALTIAFDHLQSLQFQHYHPEPQC